MNSGTRAPTSEDLLTARLGSLGITRAAIIDDAYDPPHSEDLESEIADFWGAVVRDEMLMEKLNQLKPGVKEATDFDDGLLIQLWERRDDLSELSLSLHQKLFRTRIDNLSQLKKLSDHLENLGVTPVPLGSQDELTGTFGLVFLDYHLGPGNEGAVDAAKARAREIHKTTQSDADKPFIVLMSGRPEASAAKEDFQEEAGLLGGLFGYVSKAELQNKEMLHLYLGIWAFGIPARHNIQHFVEALEEGLESAKEEFSRRIRSLGFEDYANIQWLSLQSDGHPFGDYLLWLYKSLLIHLFHQNEKVLDQQRKLDSISFKQFTPSQSPPSPELARTYRYALTEPAVSEVLTHPRAPGGHATPLLELGDLFFKDERSDVLIVINAACDLAYSPEDARAFPRAFCILLLHGKLHPYEEVNTPEAIQTELFEYEGRPYRILWDQRHVTSKSYGEIADWLLAEHYTRKARLTLPYALQVQQAFTTSLMRIGTPIGPPIFWHADAEVLCRTDPGNWVVAGELIRRAVLIIRPRAGKDETHFAVTVECIAKIVGNLNLANTLLNEQKRRLEADLAGSTSGDPRAKAEETDVRKKIKATEGDLGKLAKLLELGWWLDYVTPKRLPAMGKHKEFETNLLRVCHGAVVEDSDTSGPPIRFNIRSVVPGPDVLPPLQREGGQPAHAQEE